VLVLTPSQLSTANLSNLNTQGYSALEITAGSGTVNLSGLGSAISGFSSIIIDSGSTVDLTGTNNVLADNQTIQGAGTLDVIGTLTANRLGATSTITANVINQKNIVVCNKDPLIIKGSLTSAPGGTGLTTISQDGALEIDGAVDAGQTIQFLDGTGTLILGDPADFAGILAGLQGGDVLDFSTISPGTITDVSTATPGLLVLTMADGSTLQLNVAADDDLSKLTLITRADASGGTEIYAAPPSTVVNLSGTNDTVMAPVTPTPASGNPGAPIVGAISGYDTLTGTSDDITITAQGYNNTIIAGGGNDTINAGLSGAQVTVSNADGDNTVSGGAGNATVTLGNGDNVINLAGYSNTITLGDGDNTVSAGVGNETIKLGNGDNTVSTGGYNNKIQIGNGINTVSAGDGNATITLGTGTDTVTAGGYWNVFNIAGGSVTLSGMAGYSTINLGSGFGGTDSVDLTGTAGDSTKQVGSNWEVVKADGELVATLNVAGQTSLFFSNDASGGVVIMAQPAAPAVPTTPAGPLITQENAAGYAATGAITAIGSASAGSTVTLLNGTTVLGTAVADAASGAYSITAGQALADGTYDLTVTAGNSAGTSEASAATVVTVDTSTPVVTITNASGSIDNAQQIITGTVSGDVAPGSVVSITDNGNTTPIATAKLINGAFAVSVNLSSGGNTLVASDTDLAGTKGYSAPVTLALQQNQAPAPVSSGSNTLVETQGNQQINLSYPTTTLDLWGYYNNVSSTQGGFTIQGDDGYSTFNLIGDNNTLKLGGTGDSIRIGVDAQGDSICDGANSISGTQGSTTIIVGNGNQTINAGGFYNNITLVSSPSDTSSVNAGDGYSKVTVDGGVNNSITAAGNQNTISVNAGSSIVNLLDGGWNNTVSTATAAVTVTGGYANTYEVTGHGEMTVTDFTVQYNDVLDLSAAIAPFLGALGVTAANLVTASSVGSDLQISIGTSASSWVAADLKGMAGTSLDSLINSHSLIV